MRPKLSDAFELYRSDYIVFRNQSKKTEEMHNLALKSLISYLGDIYVDSLTFQHVRDWKEHLEKTKGQNTIRGYILKLRVVLAFTLKRGYKTLDPDIIGVPKRKSAPIDFITEEEVKLLIDAVFKPQEGYETTSRFRNRAIISLLYASGLRVSEMVSLNRLDIQKDGTFTVIGKGDKPRLCFTDVRTQIYIEDYLATREDNHPALFLSPQTGDRISKDTVQEIFRRGRKKGGFSKPIHPHTMRHSFATNLLRNNTNLMYVKEFLGHTNIQTTTMYTHVVNEDLRKIYTEKHTI